MTKITLPKGGDARQLVRVQEYARTMLDAYGLTDWKVGWGRSKIDAGICEHGGKTPKTLRFSAPLFSVWTWAQCEDTILHELAHALTPGKGHGPIWKAKCRELGAKPTARWGADGERKIQRWMGLCPSGHEINRDRRPKDRLSCLKCSPKFDLRYLFTWSERDI